MNSSRTKATPRPSTKSLSKFIARVSCTDEAFQALKNIFKNSPYAHQKGVLSEIRVAEFLRHRKFAILSSRLKTPFAEVDLLCERAGELFVVEVKSLGKLDFGPVRISQKQKSRLLRAREWMQNHFGTPTALAFAYVLPDGQIVLLNSEGDELT